MMTTELKTYDIVPERFNALQTRLEKLSRRAVKLGLNPIVMTVLAEKMVEVTVTEGDERVNRFERRIVVTVVGETPKLNGWSFVAVIEHQTEGNILHFCPPYDSTNIDISRFRTTERVCEQCKLDRNRRDTYIVVNEDGRVAQVGRNCLKDFTGHANPEALAEWAQIVAMLDEMVESFEEFEGGGRGETFYDLSSILNLSATVIRRDGFKSRSAAREDEMMGKRTQATADFILWFLGKSNTAEERRIKDEYVTLDTDIALAEAAQVWAAENEADVNNDYLWNLKIVAGMGSISSRQMGLAVSMISAYRRHLDRLEAEAGRPESQFVGTIKKRENFKLTLAKVIPVDGTYGTTFIHLFRDENGNRLTWFSSNGPEMEEGSTYEVKASVKAHDVYKGENTTIITRAVVVNNLSKVENIQMAVA